MDMSYTTNPIQSEITKIQQKADLELKSQKLAELFKEVNKLVDGYGGYNNRDGMSLQIQEKSLFNISQRPISVKRDSKEYPFELYVIISGIKYFAIISREEWAEFAKDNAICPECGKDYAEYMDYDQDEEKMFFGCRECRNGEATEGAV